MGRARLDELECTAFFVEKLSYSLGKSYTAIAESEERSDIDTYVIDERGYRTPVQNVSSEGDVLHNIARNTAAFRNGLRFEAREVNHAKWIAEVLAKKENMHYPDANKLVLLIRGSMPTPTVNEIKAMAFSDSSFAGVYYVCMPNSSEDSGYVVPLKKFWDTKDDF